MLTTVMTNIVVDKNSAQAKRIGLLNHRVSRNQLKILLNRRKTLGSRRCAVSRLVLIYFGQINH